MEENNITKDQATTAVRINTGSVDLSTPRSSPNSHTAVSVEDTVAQIRPNSRASVKSDPQTKESEITVASGSAQVQRGSEKVELGQWQRANINITGPITKSDVLAPPDLSEPLNLAPIIAEVPRAASIHFEWKPVKDAVSYTLRISTTAMFTKMVKQARVSGLIGRKSADWMPAIISGTSSRLTPTRNPAKSAKPSNSPSSLKAVPRK